MDDALRSLGQRIVEAARLALAMHLQEEATRQQALVGGADRSLSREGVLPTTGDRDGRSPLVEGRAA